MFPEFYNSSQVAELYLERAGLVAEAGEAWAKTHGIQPSSADTKRIVEFCLRAVS